MKCVKFSKSMKGLSPLDMREFCISPVAAIKAYSVKTTMRKWTGWNGTENTYRAKPFVRCDKFKWNLDSMAEMEVATKKSSLCYFSALKYGNRDNLDMEVFFGPDVAVGDLIVPLDQDWVTGCYHGIVCGEGDKWLCVALCDDGACLADIDPAPCIGGIYAAKAYDHYKMLKTA